MKNNNKKRKASDLWKLRKRFTLTFFVIILPFFFLIPGIFYFLARNGISVGTISVPITITFVLIGFLCFLLGYILSFFLMRHVFHPLEQLSNASRQIARGIYNTQIEYKGNIEEIRTTIDNFNFMAKELNSVEIMRNDFIANVSHEFKTPLSSIAGYVTLLQDSDLSDNERNEYIHMVFFNIEKLNDLTSNILQLSRLENQNSLKKPIHYRLDEQIREAIVLLEPKWSQKRISLDVDLQELSYTGQSALLFQVWTNIIGNAIKFSNPDSSISITLRRYHDDIAVTVADRGIGMSEETRKHIFEKFYQGDSSRKEQGNGLGLAICRIILDLCGGDIHVASELQKGSIFTVRLPAVELEE